MLIKSVNGDRMTFDEIQSTEKIMNDQIREWENKEHDMVERTKGIWLGIIETRKEINAIKQRRAAKESVLERFEGKIKETEARITEVEARTAQNLNDTRLDQMAKVKEKKIREQMKLLAQNQAMKTAEIMEGLLDTDMLERQRHAVINREIRIQERERAAKDELMFLITRSDEVELSIRKHVDSIKRKHAKIFELEPKIKECIKRADVVPPRMQELRQKIANAESEIKRLQQDKVKMIGEMEKKSLECSQKQKKSIKGPPMIEALKNFAPPKKSIECYQVKNPEVIKAFERFTELYGNYNRPMAH